MEYLKEPLQNWNLLSWQQLIDVSQIWVSNIDESEKRLKILCVLMGWELQGKEYATPMCDRILSMSKEELDAWMRKNLMMAEEDTPPEDINKAQSEWNTMLKEYNGVLYSNGDTKLIVKDKATGELLSIDSDNIGAAAYEYTKFLDNPSDLRHFPISEMKIGKHIYAFPDMALATMPYYQFEDVQKYEERVWNTVGQLGVLIEEVEKMKDEATIRTKNEEIRTLLDDAKEERRNMLANMLRRKKWRGIDYDITTTFPYLHLRHRWEYVLDPDLAVTDMEQAPDWLFSICDMFLQGCVSFYAGQYPKVFKKAGGGKDTKAPLIARTDTIRALMKYQGFGRLDDVKNMLVPEAFSVMNAMSEEAEMTK